MEKRRPCEGPFESMVVLGESTVEGGGWLAKTEERWADVLRALLETAQESAVRYHNAGLGASVIAPSSPGYDASAKPSAADRLDDEVIAHEPDLVVIAYGLNDMRAGMPVDDFRRELEALVRRIRAKLSPLIVLANVYHMPEYQHYPPFDRGSLEKTKQYNEMIRNVADKEACAYADVWGAQGQRDYVVNPDTVHANKVGNMLIAHKVFEAIVHASPGLVDAVRARDEETEWTRGCRAAMSALHETTN